MGKKTLSIPKITCGHCVLTIKNELTEIEGVKTVEGDPKTKLLTIGWESPATLEMIMNALKEINYPAE